MSGIVPYSKTILKGLASGKHSSLFVRLVSDEEDQIYKLTSCFVVIKFHFSVGQNKL
jgi:hypothetical protein